MSAPPRLPLHVGDYLKDTPPISRVNFEHHGIYMLSLMIAWNTPKCQLPNDPAWLASRFGCTLDEYHEHVEPVLRAYFKCDGNFFRQKRLRQEHSYVRKQSRLQSERRRSMKSKTTDANRSPHPVEPKQPSGSTPTPTPTPTLKKKESSSLRSDDSRAPPKATPRSELESVLDAVHADAVLEHRKAKRARLTVRAAKLLAGKFRQCPDPNAAADAMIANGWQGFERAWLENRCGPRAPPAQGTGYAAAAKRVIDRHRALENGEHRESGGGVDEAESCDPPPLAHRPRP